MKTFWLDWKAGWRGLRRGRLAVALVVVSLTLAIAGNVTVFGLINGLLWRPLPYPQPERLSILGEVEKGSAPGALGLAPTSLANFVDWRERQESFRALAGFRPIPIALSSAGEVERLAGAAVSPEFFTLLAARPAAGRLFEEAQAVPGNDRVAILEYRFWRSRYAAAKGPTSVLGTTLRLDGEDVTVIGVLEEGFEFLDPATQIYRPLALDRGNLPRQTRDLFVVGRLADGFDQAAAKAEMAVIMEQLVQEYPTANRGFATHVVNLREEIPDPRNRQLFGLLQGALILVLLIACVNAANLLLARSLERRQEIALRASLGAGRMQLIRWVSTESFLLAGCGGVVGLALGAIALRVLRTALAAELPTLYQPVVDARVVVFSLGISLLAAGLFSVAPAIWGLRTNLTASLADGGRAGTASRGRRWATQGLVVVEIAMALVLLGAAGVLIRSVDSLRHADPGFDTEPLVISRATLVETEASEASQRTATLRDVQERFVQLPGASAAAVASAPPRHPFLPSVMYRDPSEPTGTDRAPSRADLLVVTPGFFTVTEIDVLYGRSFNWTDDEATEPVVIVNRPLADRLGGPEQAIGRSLEVQGQTRRVIGVVEAVAHGLLGADLTRAQSALYLPFGQTPVQDVVFVVRASTQASAQVEAIRSFLEGDSRVAVGRVQTLDAHIDASMVGSRLFSTILTAFGMLALLLSALGTYGILAYSVTQRSHEIGIRRAVGATSRQIVGMILRQALVLAAVGIAVGLPGVAWATLMVSRTLEGIAKAEPATVLPTVLVLLVVTLAAGVLPSWRAARLDPNQALRDH